MGRTVITGGAGFVGSHLADRLLEAGHEVIVLDNLSTGHPRNIAHLLGNRAFRFIHHDVTDYIYVDGPVDSIFHLASLPSPVDYLQKPIPTLKVGALGTHTSLGLARAKHATFLLASTSEVYGDPQVHPQPETYWGNVNPVGPRGVYDESKRFAEAMTMAYHRYHGVDTRIFRIFNTYGPRMRPDDGRVVTNFIAQALRGEPLTVYDDGARTRSFCYVSDLVEGILRLWRSTCSDPVNLGNPREVTVLEFAKVIKELSGSTSPIEFVTPTDERTKDDPQTRQPDISRARELLGWEPRVALEDGLRAAIEYFRERLKEPRVKILVTGGAGFIGSHVVDACLAAGHDVAVLDDLSTGYEGNLNPAARLYRIDVRDRVAVADVLERERPQVIDHHAAQMSVRRSVADPVFDAEVNLIGLLNLLEEGRSRGVKQVIFASSGGTVYGEHQRVPAREGDPTEPVCPYGVAKLGSERYLHYYAHVHGLRWIAFRYGNVYGPRQDPEGEAGVIAIFTGLMLRGEEPVINGSGTQTRDYVYVGDVARANVLALGSDYCGPLNVGSGIETDVTTLFHRLRDATGGQARERHGPPKAGEQSRSVLDSSRAASVLGWTPTVDLETGLMRTVEYFRPPGEIAPSMSSDERRSAPPR